MSDLTPLILIVDDQELNMRTFENVLRPKGYVVLKAFTGRQAMDLSSKVSPDAILLARHLPDADGIELMRALKATATVHGTTPIIITASAAPGNAERLQALGAGAWEVLEHPFDPNELLLRLDTFVQAKQEADRMRDEGLTDPTTGFYNVRGVLKRTKELSADAVRFGRPLTCIAFGTRGTRASDVPERTERDDDSLARRVSQALRDVTRTSDAVGKLGEDEFVVVAPGTERDGARRLADRILEALEQTAGPVDDEISQVLRAGFHSVEGTDQPSPEDLLLRATMALRRAQKDEDSFRVRSYQA